MAIARIPRPKEKKGLNLVNKAVRADRQVSRSARLNGLFIAINVTVNEKDNARHIFMRQRCGRRPLFLLI
jgi:hypothetical protein